MSADTGKTTGNEVTVEKSPPPLRKLALGALFTFLFLWIGVPYIANLGWSDDPATPVVEDFVPSWFQSGNSGSSSDGSSSSDSGTTSGSSVSKAESLAASHGLVTPQQLQTVAPLEMPELVIPELPEMKLPELGELTLPELPPLEMPTLSAPDASQLSSPDELLEKASALLEGQ